MYTQSYHIYLVWVFWFSFQNKVRIESHTNAWLHTLCKMPTCFFLFLNSQTEFTVKHYACCSHHNRLAEQYPGNLRAGCTGCSLGCNRCLVATAGMTVQYTVQIKVTKQKCLCLYIFKIYFLLKAIIHPKAKILSSFTHAHTITNLACICDAFLYTKDDNFEEC